MRWIFSSAAGGTMFAADSFELRHRVWLGPSWLKPFRRFLGWVPGWWAWATVKDGVIVSVAYPARPTK